MELCTWSLITCPTCILPCACCFHTIQACAPTSAPSQHSWGPPGMQCVHGSAVYDAHMPMPIGAGSSKCSTSASSPPLMTPPTGSFNSPQQMEQKRSQQQKLMTNPTGTSPREGAQDVAVFEQKPLLPEGRSPRLKMSPNHPDRARTYVSELQRRSNLTTS